MYIFRKDEFIATSVDCRDFDDVVSSCFLTGDYDFVVFTEASRDFSLIMDADPKRTRIIYKDRRSPCIECGGIRTAFQGVEESTLDYLEKNPNPLLYMSPVRTWFWRRKEWFDVEADIKKRLELCADLAAFKTFLYFDDRICPEEFVPKGFKVLCPGIDVGAKNLFQMMVDNRAFAILSTDDRTIGQPRDWEIAMAMVPGLKITRTGRAHILSNPCGNYRIGLLERAADEAETFAREIPRMGGQLLNAQDFAFFFTMNERFFDAADALLCDFQLLRPMVPCGLSSISKIVEIAKERTSCI